MTDQTPNARAKTPRLLLIHADGTREEYVPEHSGVAGLMWSELDDHGNPTGQFVGWRALADRSEAFLARHSA